VQPLADAGLLGGGSIPEAALQFHSLCEGIAAVELRGTPLSPDPEQFWRNAFRALITGFPDAARPKQRRTTRRGRRELSSGSPLPQAETVALREPNLDPAAGSTTTVAGGLADPRDHRSRTLGYR
jgi:hypothetical protein